MNRIIVLIACVLLLSCNKAKNCSGSHTCQIWIKTSPLDNCVCTDGGTPAAVNLTSNSTTTIPCQGNRIINGSPFSGKYLLPPTSTTGIPSITGSGYVLGVTSVSAPKGSQTVVVTKLKPICCTTCGNNSMCDPTKGNKNEWVSTKTFIHDVFMNKNIELVSSDFKLNKIDCCP